MKQERKTKEREDADGSCGRIVWGCYDADRVDNKPDPTNKWMKLAVYHNDIATISQDGVLTALKPGESVVVALAENGDKELFPVSVSRKS